MAVSLHIFIMVLLTFTPHPTAFVTFWSFVGQCMKTLEMLIWILFFGLDNSDLHFLTVWRMIPRESQKWKEKVSINLHLVCTANPKRQETVKLVQCDAMNWSILSILRSALVYWMPNVISKHILRYLFSFKISLILTYVFTLEVKSYKPIFTNLVPDVS